MSGFDLMHTALSYWHGALSEPVLIIGREDMKRAAAGGAIVWDVRTAAEQDASRVDGALSLGEVDWLLADNSGGNLIPAPVIQDTLARTGIEPGRAVVIYAERRAVDAFVALRALRSIGIDDAQVCLGGATIEAPAPADPAPARATAAVRSTRPMQRPAAPRRHSLVQPA
jgi:rhodanese-related sulfurtransferase